jgi:RsiW-degrading membrane proteinase PrsW (M82 family)
MIMIFIVNVIAISAWITVLLKLDSFSVDKKSLQTILIFYFLGMISVIPALILYSISPIDFFDAQVDPIHRFFGNVLVVGPIEEFSKFFMFLFFSLKLKAIKEPRDGILLAASVALGFAFVENIQYGYEYGMTTVLVRSVLSNIGHMVYASIWGFYASIVIYNDIKRKGKTDYNTIVLSVLPAAFIHGVYNTLLEWDYIFIAIILKIFLLAFTIFIYRYMVNRTPFKKFPLKDFKNAIGVIKQGLKYHPGSLILHNRIAIYYLYAGYYQKSLLHLNQSLKLGSKKISISCLRGIAYILCGEHEKGRKIFSKSFYKLTPGERKKIVKRIKEILSEEVYARLDFKHMICLSCH